MRRLVTLGLLAGLALPAAALDFRSVSVSTVLYDTPSVEGKKLFVIKRYTPVEVVVSLEGWAKVRDAQGGLAWIERKALAEQRTLLVVADRAEVRQAADDSSPLVFSAERSVALELVEAGPPGWAKVRHRDGQVGYLRAAEVWGL